MRLARRTTFAVLVLILSGCGPRLPARVFPPTILPADVTKGILKRADPDGDGICTREELAAVPGLIEALPELDSDRNGILSEQEILAWFTALSQSKVAVYGSSVCILQHGTPLPNVRVQIIPEPFMGSNVKAAEGVTDESGVANLRIPDIPYGVHAGIYRVTITGMTPSGQPIDAKYQSESPLWLFVPIFGRSTNFDLD